MIDARFRHRVTHAITESDRRASHRRGYNPHALGIMLGAANDAFAEIELGITPRAALTAHFCGRLLDTILRAVEMPTSTDEEQRGTLPGLI